MYQNVVTVSLNKHQLHRETQSGYLMMKIINSLRILVILSYQYNQFLKRLQYFCIFHSFIFIFFVCIFCLYLSYEDAFYVNHRKWIRDKSRDLKNCLRIFCIFAVMYCTYLRYQRNELIIFHQIFTSILIIYE